MLISYSYYSNTTFFLLPYTQITMLLLFYAATNMDVTFLVLINRHGTLKSNLQVDAYVL